jgi:GNAT superfamily N-acetyltransferase
MEVRTLAGASWQTLAAAFTEAFSDYAVPMKMTADALEAMQRRRGFVAEASYGAFDGDRLVGFVLTCVDGDQIYNSGTGVVPSHRRSRVARQLLDAVIERVPHTRYVLEMLEDNAKAIAFYRNAGFVETRRLQCWTLELRAAPEVPAPDVPAIDAPDLDAIATRGELAPSWQNSLASIRRAIEPRIALGDEHGAAIVFPGSADLPLLTVATRRRGHGTRLLYAAAARVGKPLRILNLDDRAADIASFLAAAGARPFVRQLEMVHERAGAGRAAAQE